MLPRNLQAWLIYKHVYDQLLTGQTIMVPLPMGATTISGRQALNLATVIKVIQFLDPHEDDRSLLLTKVRIFHDTIRDELAKDHGAGH